MRWILHTTYKIHAIHFNVENSQRYTTSFRRDDVEFCVTTHNNTAATVVTIRLAQERQTGAYQQWKIAAARRGCENVFGQTSHTNIEHRPSLRKQKKNIPSWISDSTHQLSLRMYVVHESSEVCNVFSVGKSSNLSENNKFFLLNSRKNQKREK